MLSFFRQPYPVRELSYAKAIRQSVFSGVAIAFILIVFQPFGTYAWQHPNKVAILSGYGVIAGITHFTSFFVFWRTFHFLFEEKYWTIWKEMLWNLAPCILGGFLSVVYGAMVGLMPFSMAQITYMIAICFIVGLFPAVLLVLLNYAYLMQKYGKVELSYTHAAAETEVTGDAMLELVAENERDKLLLKPIDLLYVASSDNYCTIVYLDNNKVSKTLLRSSLSRLEGQLNLPNVARCHRSYLVNLDRVTSVSGNAQGYRLHLIAAAEPVPVSRAYSALVKERFMAC